MLNLLNLIVIGALPLETFTDWATGQIADFKTLIIKGSTLVVLALAVWQCAKSRFAISAIIMTLIVAALASWVIAGDGIAVVSKMFSDQAKGE